MNNLNSLHPAAKESELPDEKTGKFNFISTLERHSLQIIPKSVKTMQVNITSQCNQSCVHCHVDASPQRTESMKSDVVERCLDILTENNEIEILDISGGAPELHPEFYRMVQKARKLNKKVMVRHNLTIIFDGNAQTGETKADLPHFFADNQVEVIASLPHYQEYFTDKQRGPGVFRRSLAAIKLLNDLGYGKAGSGLVLNLVYNPAGAFLPASQAALELDYKRELLSRYGITFNHLYSITNMPVNRFKTQLAQLGIYQDYMQKLKDAFNPEAALNIMCCSQVSVGYDGKVYDCDFNQMLGLQVSQIDPLTVFNFNYAAFLQRRIIFGSHCYGCTAGAGSSCGGATT